nr:DUF4158 domain-containing protein [Pseudarthrobacter sp. SSS035]
MALRPLLTAAERCQVLALPTDDEELAAQYTLSDADMSLIRQRGGEANRLGFAVQLCLLRYHFQCLDPGDEGRSCAGSKAFLVFEITEENVAGEYGCDECNRYSP